MNGKVAGKVGWDQIVKGCTLSACLGILLHPSNGESAMLLK